MPATWRGRRPTALDAVERLRQLLSEGDAEDRRLVVAYLDAKRVLASAFESFAVERYSDPTVLEETKRRVEAQMRASYGHMSARYLRVRGFGTSHAILIAYLARSVGTEVSSAELRMLTGDAVHTERRARELRDLGYDLEARHTGGTDVYVLRSREADAKAGAAMLVARNIREDRGLSADQRGEMLRRMGRS